MQKPSGQNKYPCLSDCVGNYGTDTTNSLLEGLETRPLIYTIVVSVSTEASLKPHPEMRFLLGEGHLT